MNKEQQISVLFVCMGNICRSPTAEGVFRHVVAEAGLAERIQVDSAGTHAYHIGEPADRRARAAAQRRGISLEGIAARRVRDEDFAGFDYIVAMDQLNQVTLVDQADAEYHDKIRLFLEYSSGDDGDVPDPYYGGSAGFEHVLDLVEEASRGLLETLRSRHSF
jgi:protein-tyrosine phosphatase